jgi:serine/threonine-protein kinase HipA
MGSVVRTRGGRLSFEYDAAYAARPGATPLSVSMPLGVRTHTDARIAPWLEGLLPDNPDVVRRWATRFGVKPSPVAILGTPVGEDCAGAVRFTGATAEGSPRASGVRWLKTSEIEERLRALRADAASWLGAAGTGQFSLAGAQAKTALLLEDGRWGEPHGATPTTHILKPAIRGLDQHDLNEHLCMAAAARAGLIVARSSFEQFGGETAVVVERFDRIRHGDTISRVHQEDLCQALGLPPAMKYQADGGPTPGQLAALFRRVMPARTAESAVSQFADALIWNWLIAGTDAHAKNYGLLLAGDEIRLAPLYDVASALPYDVHERKLRFAMKIGGSYAVEVGRDTWRRCAADLGLPDDQLHGRVVELSGLAGDALADAARELAGRPGVPERAGAQLVDLIAARAARCVELVSR